MISYQTFVKKKNQIRREIYDWINISTEISPIRFRPSSPSVIEIDVGKSCKVERKWSINIYLRVTNRTITCISVYMHTVHINMRIVPNLRPLNDREVHFTVRCPRIGSRILKTHIISWDVFGTRSIANRSEINSSVEHRYHARHAWKLGWSRFRENTRHCIVCWTASSDTIFSGF